MIIAKIIRIRRNIVGIKQKKKRYNTTKCQFRISIDYGIVHSAPLEYSSTIIEHTCGGFIPVIMMGIAMVRFNNIIIPWYPYDVDLIVEIIGTILMILYDMIDPIDYINDIDNSGLYDIIIPWWGFTSSTDHLWNDSGDNTGN